MKVAVTSTGDRLDSEMDQRFGRALYILVVDTDTLDYESIDNKENKNAFKGAGIQAAAMISDKDADILITGYCGPNAFKTLEAAGIKVISDQTGRVIDVVQRFKQGQMTFAQGANKEGHWQ